MFWGCSVSVYCGDVTGVRFNVAMPTFIGLED